MISPKFFCSPCFSGLCCVSLYSHHAPESPPLYNFNRKKQTVVEFSCYRHDSPQNACQHLFDSSTHTRIFCSVIFFPPGCFDKQRHRKTSYFPPLPIRKKKMSVYLPQLSLPQHPPPPSPQLCWRGLGKGLPCAGRWCGGARVDCFAGQQRASACFLLFDMSSTPPQTNILYTQTQCASKADSFWYCSAGRWRAGRTHKYKL